MVFTVNRPKFAFKAKVVLGPHMEEASLGAYEPWPISDPLFSMRSGVVQPTDRGASTSSLEAFSPGSNVGLLPQPVMSHPASIAGDRVT
jgi:hypothetical protein